MKPLFWLSLSLVAYHFALYPLIVWVLARARPLPVRKGAYSPTVSIVIPVYNEEKIVEEKIKNTLTIDYPAEKLEILCASDGSTDRTNDIVRRYCDKKVTLIEYPEHLGKTELINRTVMRANGEIIVFTDASGMVTAGALREMAKNFADPEVGCVCGIYRFEGAPRGQTDRFEAHYIDFETSLKLNESRIYTTLGGHGALYAIRKALFAELKKGLINDDYCIAAHISIQGFRTVYEEKASVCEKGILTVHDEFRRRVRISAGNWQMMYILKELIAKRMYGLAAQFISHKLIRTAIPLFLIALFLSSFFIEGSVYMLARGVFIAWVLAALLGWASLDPSQSRGAYFIPFFVFLENVAYAWGTFTYLCKRGTVQW